MRDRVLSSGGVVKQRKRAKGKNSSKVHGDTAFANPIPVDNSPSHRPVPEIPGSGRSLPHHGSGKSRLLSTKFRTSSGAFTGEKRILLTNSTLWQSIALRLISHVFYSNRERAIHPSSSQQFFLGRGTSQYGGDGLPMVSPTGDFGFESIILSKGRTPERRIPEGRLQYRKLSHS